MIIYRDKRVKDEFVKVQTNITILIGMDKVILKYCMTQHINEYISIRITIKIPIR